VVADVVHYESCSDDDGACWSRVNSSRCSCHAANISSNSGAIDVFFLDIRLTRRSGWSTFHHMYTANPPSSGHSKTYAQLRALPPRARRTSNQNATAQSKSPTANVACAFKDSVREILLIGPSGAPPVSTSPLPTQSPYSAVRHTVPTLRVDALHVVELEAFAGSGSDIAMRVALARVVQTLRLTRHDDHPDF
jgi:hypothetical protein